MAISRNEPTKVISAYITEEEHNEIGELIKKRKYKSFSEFGRKAIYKQVAKEIGISLGELEERLEGGGDLREPVKRDPFLSSLTLDEAIKFLDYSLQWPIDFEEKVGNEEINQVYLHFNEDRIITWAVFQYNVDDQTRAISLNIGKRARKYSKWHPIYGESAKPIFRDQDKADDMDRLVWYMLIKDL